MIGPLLRCPLQRATRARRRAVLLASLVALIAVACGSAPFTLDATGPVAYPANFAYPANVDSSLERVAILVTITNRSGADLLINPADFVARDANHRIYLANLAATSTDTPLASRPLTMRGSLPLPTVTMRQDDVLSGFVVFDVPAGVRLVGLIWRQSDTDSTVTLATAR